MNAARLLQHFERISEAPDAVPRLRRFILDLAVRGKLVEQNPKDEPASELLKRIAMEKVRLMKEGKMRNPRALEASEEGSEPFQIPVIWTWCRLSEVGAIVGGGTPPSADADNFTNGGSGTAWLTPADLGKHTGRYVSHGARDLTPQGLRSSSATLMPKGSVLFTSRAPIGYTAIAANEVSTNQGFKSVVPFIPACNLYIAVYFRAFGKWIDGKASGTTFREVSGKIVANLPFPLPPLAEQHRIVAKVNELMALCDRLEAAQAERESRRDRLAVASLNRLNQPADAGDAPAFREHAGFHLRHLPRLTVRPEQIKQLHQAILNLAVRGNLAPQNPSDNPASELLKRIEAEKKRLIAEGRIRRQQPLAENQHGNAFLQLPQSWKAVRLFDVAYLRSGIAVEHGEEMTEGDIPYVKVADLSLEANRSGIVTSSRFIGGKHRDSIIASGSIVFPKRGGAIATNRKRVSHVEIVCDSNLMAMRPYLCETTPYLQLWFSGFDLWELNSGTSVPQINNKDIYPLSIPFPPLAEQHRIVTKVNELMALCDRLETQLKTTQTENCRFLEAVLEEALRSGHQPVRESAVDHI